MIDQDTLDALPEATSGGTYQMGCYVGSGFWIALGTRADAVPGKGNYTEEQALRVLSTPGAPATLGALLSPERETACDDCAGHGEIECPCCSQSMTCDRCDGTGKLTEQGRREVVADAGTTVIDECIAPLLVGLSLHVGGECVGGDLAMVIGSLDGVPVAAVAPLRR